MLDGRYPGAQRSCRPCIVPGWSTLGALTGSSFASILPQHWGEGVQEGPRKVQEAGESPAVRHDLVTVAGE